jgi:hypothetical protein
VDKLATLAGSKMYNALRYIALRPATQTFPLNGCLVSTDGLVAGDGSGGSARVTASVSLRSAFTDVEAVGEKMKDSGCTNRLAVPAAVVKDMIRLIAAIKALHAHCSLACALTFLPITFASPRAGSAPTQPGPRPRQLEEHPTPLWLWAYGHL